MNTKISRTDILRKCIIVFDAMRRVSSKGNAGLEPAKDSEESYWLDTAICDGLREWLREIEAGRPAEDVPRAGDNKADIHDWQNQIMKDGVQGRLDL